MGGGLHQHLCHACHLLPVGSSWRIDRQDSQPSPHHRHLETPVPLSHQLPPLHLALLENHPPHTGRLFHSLSCILFLCPPPSPQPLSGFPPMGRLLPHPHRSFHPTLLPEPTHPQPWSQNHDATHLQMVKYDNHDKTRGKSLVDRNFLREICFLPQETELLQQIRVFAKGIWYCRRKDVILQP